MSNVEQEPGTHRERPAVMSRAGAGQATRHLLPFGAKTLQAADLLLLLVALLVVTGTAELRSALQAGVLALCVLAWRVLLVLAGVYAPARASSGVEYGLRYLIGLNSCALLVALRSLLLHGTESLWRRLGLFWVLSLSLMGVARAVLLAWERLRPRLHAPRRVLIVGSGQRASQAARELERHPQVSYRVIGYVDSEPQESYVPAAQILGGVEDLQHLLRLREVDEVLLALPMSSQYEAVGYSLGVCQSLGVPTRYFAEREATVSGGHGQPWAAPAQPKAVERNGWLRRLGQELVSAVAGHA